MSSWPEPRHQTGQAAPGLSVWNLTKRFGQTLAVDRLSFSVSPGSVLALLGPNGAGKTTTLMCLAGLLRPDFGQVFWNGVELGHNRGRQIGLITETPEVYEMLTVWEHMVFVARSCRLATGWRSDAEGLLRRVGLAQQHNLLGDALSKGMRQRLLIAATVLAATPVLLLDEPMIGLDPRGQRELRDILLDLRKEGRTIIVSTHLLENVESFCDRLLILNRGQKVAEDDLQALLSRLGTKNLEEAFFQVTE